MYAKLFVVAKWQIGVIIYGHENDVRERLWLLTLTEGDRESREAIVTEDRQSLRTQPGFKSWVYHLLAVWEGQVT